MGLIKTTSQSKVPLDHSKFGYTKLPGAPTPIPLQNPPFKISDIRAVIPPHCFDRSLPISLAYLTIDLSLIGTLLYSTRFMPYFPQFAQYFLWPGYCVLQGLFMSALFVIGHECGHDSFSKYPLVNNILGLFCHSILMTPYVAFKMGHRKHHHFTNNCDHDEIFVPPSRTELEEERSRRRIQSAWKEAIEESPIYSLVCMIGKFVFFFPAYILLGKYRLKKYRQSNMNLFSPSCALYSPQDYMTVIWSDLGIVVMILVYGYLGVQWGVPILLARLIIPYFLFNFYFAMGTFLQHTDTMVPKFRDPEWNWMRGALATVDRSLGTLLDEALHHILDTHVVHHLFPKMPFYHAVEATEKVKHVLGQYYLKDDTPICKALWRSYVNCKFIEDIDPIVFCKKSLSHE